LISISSALNHHGLALLNLGRPTEAEPLLRRALAIFEAALGPDHPGVATRLSNLVELLRDTGRMSEAGTELLVRRALASSEAALGPDHPDVARDLNNLAELLQVTARPAEAEPLLRRALVISEVALGPDHPDVAHVLSNLAGLLRNLVHPAEAEPLLRRALEIKVSFTRAAGHLQPHLGLMLENYIVLLLEINTQDQEIQSRLREILGDRLSS
jgi:tetratricopeptide (TPR) repeat protein